MDENLLGALKCKKEKGYRIYKRLSPKEKRIFTKSDLEPRIKTLALLYGRITGKPLERSLLWAEWNHRDYFNQEEYNPKLTLSQKSARRELIFRGFVPVEEFKKLPKYGYIQTNANLPGEELIYPRHFGYWDGTLKPGFPNVYNIIQFYGLQNYTRVEVIKPTEYDSNIEERKPKPLGKRRKLRSQDPEIQF